MNALERGLLWVAPVAMVAWAASCGGQSAVDGETKPGAPSSSAGVGGSGLEPPSGSETTTGGGETGPQTPVCGDDVSDDPEQRCVEGLSCDLPSAPCGGDVVGTWKVMDCPLALIGMVDVTELGLGCAFGMITSGMLEVSGTWTADAMGTFSDNTTTQGAYEFTLPKACMDVGIITSCPAIGNLLRGAVYDTLECVDNLEMGGCLCSGTFHQQGGLAAIASAPLKSGNYSTTGNLLTTGNALTAAGRIPETTYGYCAMDGGAMVWRVAAAGMVGLAWGSIVLQKQ